MDIFRATFPPRHHIRRGNTTSSDFPPSDHLLQICTLRDQTERLGLLTITVSVDLKKGWSWVSEDAEEVPFRGDDAKARLLLDWTLDFAGHEGKGSMGRCRLKVRKEGDGERREREEEDRVNDGRWEVEMVNDDEGEEEENGDGEEGEEEEEEEEMFEGTSDISDE
ncbi:unnamed protein product [Aureobasidium pullulans]|nr:unnamed protein product [Aureobasidium pullulans]